MPAGQYLFQDHPRRIMGGNITEIEKGFSKTDLSWMFTSYMLMALTVAFIYSIIMGFISPLLQIRILGFFKVIGWSILLFGDVTVNIFHLTYKIRTINSEIIIFRYFGIFLQERLLELEFRS